MFGENKASATADDKASWRHHGLAGAFDPRRYAIAR
jgi:hypothetical protein